MESCASFSGEVAPPTTGISESRPRLLPPPSFPLSRRVRGSLRRFDEQGCRLLRRSASPPAARLLASYRRCCLLSGNQPLLLLSPPSISECSRISVGNQSCCLRRVTQPYSRCKLSAAAAWRNRAVATDRSCHGAAPSHLRCSQLKLSHL